MGKPVSYLLIMASLKNLKKLFIALDLNIELECLHPRLSAVTW
jgi:hypothetical protein